MNILNKFNLKNKTALVTGGAGLYGRQIVRALAEAGANTIMASRNIDNLEKQAKVFCDDGLNVSARQLDQSDEKQIITLREQLDSEFGGVDILVNNAASRPMKSWDDNLENFRKSVEVNVTGIFAMTRVFGNYMAEHGNYESGSGGGGGSIINIGSIYGMVGPDFSLYKGLGIEGGIPDYWMHKGAMVQLTKFAAAKLGPKGVRVNTISPGGFFNNQDETFVKRYNDRTFLGRMADDSDLMGAVVFLASDASSYITGTNIPVDGGFTAK